MKLVVLFVVLCAAIVCANEEAGERMTEAEIQELINDYKDLNKKDGENAQVN